ncbi:Type VI secretion system (T6SS), amidase effector protein 4 [Pseudomonas sp. NFACC15-1]|uniref:type VI secretion system amidase effector protein Tae4 n=1 Tax=Pseudomonas TaxID=286 RepID=UPI0008714425|nr:MULTISPECIES: type VI secretion system amidase effector protein Tae4 [unclassified Pseudomonas]SCW59484.1 Type VI secretion system (T6SS), amidase effector protein 4 [Pseudomonas sp. NFACC56-3]SDA61201.1 Type VI secretion system (T6SS), amidase effector protein 4 [Pseudomonas sp. NFACC15-1]SDB66922.1 Type VI secretion system (T6SS), amidase effector protein 4 [Pseudomonas sp. NFACC13-1]SDX79787.1 Type VI secretion system (T6SS), amidase effector protein 4 [Pseudomonas sp. NFACC14]SFB30758.1
MAKPSFINLWKAYSDLLVAHPDAKPCDGPWANQCAIRMSLTLNAEKTIKVNKSTYTKDPLCKHEHARGAESLANWLWKHHLGAPTRLSNSTENRRTLMGKTGLIFFKDCFQQSGETAEGRSGDHIDLWNRGLTQTSDLFYRSKEIWFWELT